MGKKEGERESKPARVRETGVMTMRRKRGFRAAKHQGWRSQKGVSKGTAQGLLGSQGSLVLSNPSPPGTLYSVHLHYLSILVLITITL